MRLRPFLAGSAMLLLSLAAHADTLTRTISESFSGATSTVEDFGGIALFDPSLGTLNSVTQTITGQLIFTPNGMNSSYTISAQGQGTPITTSFTFSSSQNLNIVAVSGPTLEESTNQFGQQYIIVPFDISIQGGSLSTVGRISDTFIFDYTPAATAATPEPSSLALLGTGILGVIGAARRRFA